MMREFLQALIMLSVTQSHTEVYESCYRHMSEDDVAKQFLECTSLLLGAMLIPKT